jgi:hypothetical protein
MDKVVDGRSADSAPQMPTPEDQAIPIYATLPIIRQQIVVGNNGPGH